MQSNVAELPLSDRLLTWFERNRTQALWGSVVLCAAGLIAGFVVWHQGEKELTAGEALSKVAFPEFAGERAGNPAAYLKIAADYPSSSAGTRALLLGATALFTEGKFAEAHTQFERFAKEHNSSPFVSQAMLGAAASLDAQGKTNEAIAAYKMLTERHPGQAVIPQAKFAMARLYEGQGKPELAKPLFEEISRGDPYASISSEAGMRLEELKLKHPNLFPPPAPAPAPPGVATNLISPMPGTNAAPLKLENR